ncbi:helix-turn-helix transcriptional regulator [Saccharomonospora sp. NPDC006951]
MASELGHTVRHLRTLRGWTQARLASAAGMTQPAIARFEAGATVPTIPVLERLAHALGAELFVDLLLLPTAQDGPTGLDHDARESVWDNKKPSPGGGRVEKP